MGRAYAKALRQEDPEHWGDGEASVAAVWCYRMVLRARAAPATSGAASPLARLLLHFCLPGNSMTLLFYQQLIVPQEDLLPRISPPMSLSLCLPVWFVGVAPWRELREPSWSSWPTLAPGPPWLRMVVQRARAAPAVCPWLAGLMGRRAGATPRRGTRGAALFTHQVPGWGP